MDTGDPWGGAAPPDYDGHSSTWPIEESYDGGELERVEHNGVATWRRQFQAAGLTSVMVLLRATDGPTPHSPSTLG